MTSRAIIIRTRYRKASNPMSTALALHSHDHRSHEPTSSFNSKDSCDQHRRHYSSLPISNNFHSSNLSNNVHFNYKNHKIERTKVVRLLSSEAKEDFYKILGVTKEADKGKIKKAYFKLAKEYHPDTNQGDAKAAEKFKQVTEAYETLSDNKQRELYDAYGHAGVDPNSGFGGGGNPFGSSGGPFGPGGGYNFGDGSFHFSSNSGSEINPEDLFDAFFGGGARQRGPKRGSDLQMRVSLTFQEAAFGVKRDLNVKYQFRNSNTGRVEIKSSEVEVTIPAGVNNGMNLRLAGQGGDGDPGAPKGDLIVNVTVEEDDFFHRDGANVHVEVPISVTQAILGGSVDVKTLHGEVEMTVPKGCQPDSKLLMRGKGIPYVNGRGQMGNQIVHLKLQIPKRITQKQEQLLRDFDKEAQANGLGISGRLAKAAGSAFDSLFGSKSDEKPTNKADTEETPTNMEEQENMDKEKQKAQ